MQIREGAYYRARNGAIYGPMLHVKSPVRYPFRIAGVDYEWGVDGFYQSDLQPTQFDLISEVYVSDTPPAVKETEAELRDMLVPSGPLTAMPIMRPVSGPNGPLMEVHDRKTLRDEFAMEAMKKMMDMSGLDAGAHHEESNRAALAKLSYGIATAMMEAREK
jgi:hypothetical protein